MIETTPPARKSLDREPFWRLGASSRYAALHGRRSENQMLYRKNVFAWEQVVRVIAGAAMIGYGLVGLPGDWLGYGLALMGIYVILTGFFGYCPACAMLGRKPVKDPRS
ncbi:MAG TPA: DUF2892 domain-containing protein [Devosia sp.]|uniref:YgaP family membrane protein n=1 Tax=Devosia sp. TaxID=1871048 RepID=UPI002DDCE146|nr:DUF2892 domain-containing protein [Devosia sp.]HEV2513715.1 DUF2892 domain-containing protein [Devosia sp.]